MEIATSRQLPKVVRLALIGTGAAFAWIVLSFVLGLGASNANAAESDDDGLLGGALGAVTSLVDQTASTVTGTVSGVTSGVTGVVNSVVDVAPAPVQQPVSQVVQSVGAVVTAVTQPVSDVVSGGVVSGITQPVVDVVTQVPVVGGIVSGIGLDDAVTDLGETVDDTLGGVVDAVDETGATVGQPPVGAPLPGTPGLPGIPDLPLVPALPGLTDAGQNLAADAFTETVADAAAVTYAKPRSLSAAWSSDGAPAVVHSSVAPSAILPGTSGVPGNEAGLCLASSSAGPGGAGPGAWAISALGPLDADRAWTHRAGPEDDHAPLAPVGSTDVSPD